MSKHLLEILLAELATLRLRCTACGVIYELPLLEVTKKLPGSRCPACDADWGIFDSASGQTALGKLAMAVRALSDKTNALQVSVVIESKPGE